MTMEKISVEKAKEIADEKGLKPGLVEGTDGVQFTKGGNDNIKVISWDDFEDHLEERDLAVHESGGWMKIMKED